VVTAFLFAEVFADSRASMLPGFRFLFAAIMLSMSLLVFGLGAAALLRAAHESFASNSSWRGAPEVTFAQRTEPALPMLATLRVDTPVMEKAPEAAAPAAPSVEISPAMSAPAMSEQVAALNPVDAAPAEITTSEAAPPAMLPAENLPPAITPGAPTATGDQTPIVAVTPSATSSAASEPVRAPPGPTSAPQQTPVADQAGIATTKIATLGGPPVDVIKDTPATKDKAAKPRQSEKEQSGIKRRAEAKRGAHRRRLAARSRFATQQQLQGNPFGQQSFAPAAAPR
jgi:hypothetical protein